MSSINVNNSTALNLTKTNKYQNNAAASKQTTANNSESTKVTLSDEAKKLLANSPEAKAEDADEPSVLSSFAHGALGLDNPDKTPDEDDTSYNAGKYFKAAVTAGSLLLIIV